MIAIRDAGGRVLTSHVKPSRSKSVDGSPSAETCTSVSISRSTSHEPVLLHASATDRQPQKPSASSTVSTVKKTWRVIEPPKPTPHEQLMVAIRNAGGMTSRKSADCDRSLGSPHAFSSSTSTVAESAKISMAERSSGLPQISGDSCLKHGSGSAVPSTDHVPPAAGPSPPPAPLNFATSSAVASEAPKAAPRKLVPAARTTPTRAAQTQPLGAREALLSAIRDAAGGKGLRKVSVSTVPHFR